MAEMQETYLTVPQVADQLSMTADGVYKLIQRGELVAKRVSARSTWVGQTDLDEYIRRQQEAVEHFLAAATVQDTSVLSEHFRA